MAQHQHRVIADPACKDFVFAFSESKYILYTHKTRVYPNQTHDKLIWIMFFASKFFSFATQPLAWVGFLMLATLLCKRVKDIDRSQPWLLLTSAWQVRNDFAAPR
jgi:hypothetical protein